MNLRKLLISKTKTIDAVKEAKEVVSRIKSKTPLKEAYLVGSALENHFDTHSDIDLVLVYPSELDLKSLHKKIYSKRWSNTPLDLLIYSSRDFEKRRDLGGICFEAYQNGLRLL